MDKLSFKRMLILALITVCIALSIPAPGIRASAQDDPIARQTRAMKADGLIAVIKNESLLKSDPERVYVAIEELGRLKSTEAIEPLASLMTVRREFDYEKQGLEFKIITEESRYPAVGALIGIGKPALDKMIDVIKKEEPESLASRNAIFVIHCIYRYEPEAGVRYVNQFTEKETDPDIKRKLQYTESRIKDFYGTYTYRDE